MIIRSLCRKIREMLMLRFAKYIHIQLDENDNEIITSVELPEESWLDRLIRWLASLERYPKGHERCAPHARVTAAEEVPPVYYKPDKEVKRKYY